MSRLRFGLLTALIAMFVAATNLTAQQSILDQQRAAHTARIQALRSNSYNRKPIQKAQSSRRPGRGHAQTSLSRANSPLTNIRFLGATQLSLGDRFAVGQPLQGDFNGDGKLDAAVVAFDYASGYYLAMFAGYGDGTFNAPVYTSLGTNQRSTPIAGDLNGDGRTDIIVPYGYNGSNVPASAYTGNADGTFTLSSSFIINDQNWPSGATLADVNDDGKLDLLVAVNSNVHTLLGNGDGTFQADTAAVLGDGSLIPYAPVFADVNGDGKLDVVGNDGDSNVFVFMANGGGYANGVAYAEPAPTWWYELVTVADVNGDGHPDIVAANYNDEAIIYLNNGDGTFGIGVAYSTGYDSYPTAIAVADVNRDGKADLISVNASSGDITILLGNGDGTFSSPTVGYASSDWPHFMPLVGDFNGDGKLDVVLSGAQFNLVYLQGYGDGTFRAAHTLYTPVIQDSDPSGAQAWSWDIAAGDLNGDGKPDAVVGNCCNNVVGVSVFLSNGDGTFQPPAKYGTGGGLEYVRLADMNGDGKLDIVAADVNNDNVSVFLNNGDGSFPPTPVTYDLSGGGDWPLMIAVGDFNGDGYPDVAVLMDTNLVAVLLNNGSGALQTPVTYPVSTYPVAITNVDVNNDGRLDLVIAEYDGTVGVLLGNGDGTFQPASELTNLGSSPRDLTLADFNGDGKLDLAATVVTWPLQNDVVVAFGNGDGTFQTPVNMPASVRGVENYEPYPVGIRAADIDGDGKLDLVWSNSNYNTVAIAYGKGDGTFYDPVETPSGGYPAYLAVADFSGDGALDVVTADDSLVGMSLLLNAGGSVTTMSASPNPAYVSQLVTLTAQVSASVQGVSAVPSGNVTFHDGSTTLGSAALDGTGTASLSLSTLSAGSHTITGAYTGDANFVASSGTIIVTVNAASAPTVTTSTITGITQTAATGGGIVSSDGGAPVTARGVCWSTSANPTTGDSCTSDGTGTGTFTSSITGLIAATTYHVRAYGTNSVGTSYGPDLSFTTLAADNYNVSASPTSASIKAGASASFTLTVTPINGFDSAVTFSCGTLPPGVTCTFNPASVTPNGGSVTSTLTIATTGANLAQLGHSRIGLAACFSLFGCVLLGVRGRWLWPTASMAIALLLLASLVGCGGGGNSNAKQTPPGSYLIQVSATSASVQQVELTLNVQ